MLYKERIVALDLGKVEGCIALCAEPLKEILLAQLRRCNLKEPIVVLAGHTHIYIVVPGHHTFIIKGTYGTTSLYKVGDVVLLAYAVYLREYLVEHRVQSL